MIGVSSYSFGEYLKKISVKEIMEYAKNTGFDCIEFSGFPQEGDKAFLIDEAKRIKDTAEEVGIKINNYCVSADLVNYRDGAKSLEEEIKRIEDRVDVAEALGVDKMRHDVAWGWINGGRRLLDFFEGLPLFADACREITIYAEQKNIKTMFENHGFFVQKADRCEALLETVNHPNFGLLMDMGNFICGDDNHFNSVKKLAKYAFHCHAKDFYTKEYTCPDEEGWFRSDGGTMLLGSVLGEGVINPAECIKIIKDMGYKGDFSLEYEGKGDHLEGIKAGFKVLKENV